MFSNPRHIVSWSQLEVERTLCPKGLWGVVFDVPVFYCSYLCIWLYSGRSSVCLLCTLSRYRYRSVSVNPALYSSREMKGYSGVCFQNRCGSEFFFQCERPSFNVGCPWRGLLTFILYYRLKTSFIQQDQLDFQIRFHTF